MSHRLTSGETTSTSSHPNTPSHKSDDVVFTPSSSPSNTPKRTTTSNDHTTQIKCILEAAGKMDTAREDKAQEHDQKIELSQENGEPSSSVAEVHKPSEPNGVLSESPKTKKKCKLHSKKNKKGKKSKSSKKAKAESSASESSDSDSSDSGSESDSEASENSEEEEKRRRKERSKRNAAKKQVKKKKKSRKSKKYESSSESSSDSSSESSESESEEDTRRARRRKAAKKSRKRRVVESESDSESSAAVSDAEDDGAVSDALLQKQLDLQRQLEQIQLLRDQDTLQTSKKRRSTRLSRAEKRDRLAELADELTDHKKKSKKSKKKAKRASTLEYKRVDQLWDSTIHNYKLTESVEEPEDEFDHYIFTVRRKFDWENKYRNTVVDIKSKVLRDALQEVMKDVKGVSLVEEQPSVDPNMLFLYLEELRTHAKKTLKSRLKKEKKKKNKRKISQSISHCKVLISYLDGDYDETKKTLYPLLEAGNITFDLLWALFKPNTLAYTTTYGSVEDPRCFKVDYANKESSFIRGEWYCIEGRYMEYDGKNFGLGDFEINVDSFKGPRKITSLATYPLVYHKDPEGVKKKLIERGKRFVQMQGMNYRFHKGLAFMKKKKAVAKVNINGRIMIDPAIFRRINPNYPISLLKPKEQDELFGGDSDSECSDCCGCGSDDEDDMPEGAEGPRNYGDEDVGKERTKIKVVRDKEDKLQVVEVPVNEDGEEIQVENLDNLANGETESKRKDISEFTEEELLIASPVVLGFAFSEKLWLEFTLSGVREIEWNDGAFQSLVLPPKQKSVVKALVSTHKFHAAETIDDVVQGKGRGLVFVLHGPPGVGKTLTAEGIAEVLKCPLYAVSAGELGTDSRLLEHELQKIMDIAHSWGAVLLLDEADVFLEKREVHDIHRNALVSIFLRLLEYFQGILFLTTNRVETFDDAFQSRIHVALRYEELGFKAKKEIWKMFLERVRVMEGIKVMPFTDRDYDTLAKKNINGRQIKNAVRTAQALAVDEKKELSMEHVKRVLEVAESFDRDLKGGSGYLDAMRSYT